MKKLKILLAGLVLVVFFIFVIFLCGKIWPHKFYSSISAFEHLFSFNSPDSSPYQFLSTSDFPQSDGTDFRFSFRDQTVESLAEQGAVWNDSLMLISAEHPIPDGYDFDLSCYRDTDVVMNSCIHDAYFHLKTRIKRKFDNSLYIMSAYRTPEEQAEAIESEGELAVAVSTSEHQSGLALDVYVKYHAGYGFLDSDEGKFVNSYCDEYGFIIRYPYYGENVTGIDYEPWHLRYVGLPHSQIIMKNRLTLEEYVEMLTPDEIFLCGDYLITRQKTASHYYLPEELTDLVLSPDNTGHTIITGKIKK